MAKVCDICGKRALSGNRVSHANNATKRKFQVNLSKVRANVNGTTRRIKVCTSCIRNGRVQKAV